MPVAMAAGQPAVAAEAEVVVEEAGAGSVAGERDLVEDMVGAESAAEEEASEPYSMTSGASSEGVSNMLRTA